MQRASPHSKPLSFYAAAPRRRSSLPPLFPPCLAPLPVLRPRRRAVAAPVVAVAAAARARAGLWHRLLGEHPHPTGQLHQPRHADVPGIHVAKLPGARRERLHAEFAPWRLLQQGRGPLVHDARTGGGSRARCVQRCGRWLLAGRVWHRRPARRRSAAALPRAPPTLRVRRASAAARRRVLRRWCATR